MYAAQFFAWQSGESGHHALQATFGKHRSFTNNCRALELIEILRLPTLLKASPCVQLWDELAECVPGGISKENPIMLLLDGHESRLDIDCLDAAAERGIHIFLLPGNCTTFLQPMDQWCALRHLLGNTLGDELVQFNVSHTHTVVRSVF